MNVTFKLNPTSGAYLKDAVSGDVKVVNAWIKASEALFADGIRAEHLAPAKSGGITEVRDFVTASITSGLPERFRKVMLGDVKALDDSQKALRKEGQQRLGVYRNRLAKYLTDLAVATGEVEPEDKAPKTVAEKLQVVLETAAKLVQGDENPQGYDPVEMAKAINTALKLIK